MYVPIYTTVINKTTMYSDIVLPLKDIGDNLKLISINKPRNNLFLNLNKLASNSSKIPVIVQYSLGTKARISLAKTLSLGKLKL